MMPTAVIDALTKQNNRRKTLVSKPTVISCNVMGGRNPRTGERVGSRHRWSGGAWGVGRCDFCGRYLDDVLEKPKQEISLDRAISLGETSGNEFDWAPHYDNGEHGSISGWYIRRQSKESFGPDWMRDAQGKLLRFETREMAEDAITTALTSTDTKA